MSFTIAIDGPAAAGKGTISKAVAAHFMMAHLDTGLLYRAVGAQVIAGSDPLKVAQSLQAEDLQRPGLRTAEVAQAASQVAVMADVRAELLEFQRRFARSDGGAVLDGRDIGTVVCQEATAKLFITASTEVRANRRFKELHQADSSAIYARVLEDMKERDERDSSRSFAPLVAAKDANVIDTSDLSANQVFDQALIFIATKTQKA